VIGWCSSEVASFQELCKCAILEQSHVFKRLAFESYCTMIGYCYDFIRYLGKLFLRSLVMAIKAGVFFSTFRLQSGASKPFFEMIHFLPTNETDSHFNVFRFLNLYYRGK